LPSLVVLGNQILAFLAGGVPRKPPEGCGGDGSEQGAGYNGPYLCWKRGLGRGGVQVHTGHIHLHLLRPEVMDTAAGEEALAEPGGLNGDLYRFEEKLEAR